MAAQRPGGGRHGAGRRTGLCLDAATGQEIWKHEYDCSYAISYPAGPRCTSPGPISGTNRAAWTMPAFAQDPPAPAPEPSAWTLGGGFDVPADVREQVGDELAPRRWRRV